MKTDAGSTPHFPPAISPGQYVAMGIPILLCVFLLLTSVTDVLPEYGIFNSKRLIQVGILPILFLLALLSPRLRTLTSRRLAQIPGWVLSGLAVFLLLGAASSLRLDHPGYALLDVGMLFTLLMGVLVVAAARSVAGNYFDRAALALLALTGAAVMLQELMGLLASWSTGNEFSYQSMFIYFAHPRFFNQVQTWSVPLIAALPFVFGYAKKTLITAVVLLGMQWYLLFASGARGSIIGLSLAVLLVAMTSVAVTSRGTSLRWLRLHLGGALLGLVVYGVVLWLQNLLVPHNGQFLTQSLGRSMLNTTGRSWFWQVALKDALEHPWLGVGPVQFGCSVQAALPAHPHNLLLQILAEWGFPAAMVTLVLITYAGIALFRNLAANTHTPQSGGYGLRLSLSASLVAGAIHSGVSGLLVMPASQVMAMITGGWLLGLLPCKDKVRSAYSATRPLLVVAIIISLSVAAFAVLEVRQLTDRLSSFNVTETSMPRFWQEGRACKYVYPDGKHRAAN